MDLSQAALGARVTPGPVANMTRCEGSFIPIPRWQKNLSAAIAFFLFYGFQLIKIASLAVTALIVTVIFGKTISWIKEGFAQDKS
jgi:hypothetical protein